MKGGKLILTLTLSAGLVSCDRSDDSDTTETKPPQPATLEQELQLRQELDSGVWKEERLAQFYEQRVVRLWDQIRRSPNKFNALSLVAFKNLEVPSAQEPVNLDNGITRRAFTGSANSFDRITVRERLAELSKSGHRLAQSEWHHQSFKFDPSTKIATSDINFTLHVVELKKPRHSIVKGTLKVVWDPLVDENNVPEFNKLTATNLTITERDGVPGFNKVAEIDARKLGGPVLSVQPLIVYDLNGDGLSEVILGGSNLVHWNQGGGRFKRAPFLKHAPGEISESALLADFTGDGWVDFLCVTGRDRSLTLFPGNKDGAFEQAGAKVAPIQLQNPSVLTTGDIDGDGDLDVWLTQYKVPYVGGQMPTPYFDANDGFPSYLLLNDGKGSFQDVTKERGLEPRRLRRTYSSSLVDLDEDQDLDLIVVSDFSGVDLYQNDGKGHFTDVRDQWVDEWHNFGMAHTFGDYDLDGSLDFYVIGMSSTTARRLDGMGLKRTGFEKHAEQRSVMGFGNRMYLRRGSKFAEPPFRKQVARTGWSWGCTTFDFENDGDQDIYVANGHISGDSAQDYCSTFWCHDIYTGSSKIDPIMQQVLDIGQAPLRQGAISWNGFEKNALLMNREGKEFTDISFLMNVALSRDCRGVVSDDLNGDGLVDLLVVEEWSKASKKGQILHVFMNQFPTDNKWIGVRVSEQGHSTHAVGTKVTMQAGGRKWVDHIVNGDSFFSQHAPVVHFGLGKLTSVESIEIQWPNGSKTTLNNPAVGEYHTVQPGS